MENSSNLRDPQFSKKIFNFYPDRFIGFYEGGSRELSNDLSFTELARVPHKIQVK